MSMSARQLVEYCRASIKSLSLDPAYGTLEAVYRDISQRAGVSRSMVIKLYSGEAANPTADKLDRLVEAIRSATRKAAA